VSDKEIVGSWFFGSILGALILLPALCYLVQVISDRFCKHQWIKDGERTTFQCRESGAILSQEIRQPVRCEKCGRLTWFKIG